MTTYKRAGDVFTKLANPATLPPNTGYGVAYSPDDTYLTVAHNSSPRFTIYKRAGDVFTKLANPAALPPGDGRGASWSPDNGYLAISHQNSPYVTTYSRSGDVFTKLSNPATLPTGNSAGLAYSDILNAAPTAPTLIGPADLAEVPADKPLLYDWVFNDPDAGNTQSEFALVRRKVAP